MSVVQVVAVGSFVGADFHGSAAAGAVPVDLHCSSKRNWDDFSIPDYTIENKDYYYYYH
jgi:hypothetical protein